MNFFQQRQNKRFSYNTRFDKNKNEISNQELKEQWKSIKASGIHSRKRRIGLPFLLILLVIIVLVMYYIETLLA